MKTLRALTILMTASLLSVPAFASESVETVELTSHLIVGFGADYPGSTGEYLVTLPPGLTVAAITEIENFDMMCELDLAKATGASSFAFGVYPSSSEGSSCAYDVQLSDGTTARLTGAWSSGD